MRTRTYRGRSEGVARPHAHLDLHARSPRRLRDLQLLPSCDQRSSDLSYYQKLDEEYAHNRDFIPKSTIQSDLGRWRFELDAPERRGGTLCRTHKRWGPDDATSHSMDYAAVG